MRNISIFEKYNVSDILILLAIIFQYAGDLWIIPINVNTICMALLGISVLGRGALGKAQISVPFKTLLIIAYVSIITMLNYHDNSAIKNLILFGAYFIIVTLYFLQETNKYKALNVIYIAAVILAVYGLLQEVGYFLRIQWLYDPTLWGFKRFYATEIGNSGLIYMYSLYDEPSHLASVFCGGVLIGTYHNEYTGRTFSFTNPLLTVLIGMAAVLTYSATVYLCLAATVIATLLLAKAKTRNKLLIFFTAVVAVVCFFVIFKDAYNKIIVQRVAGIFTEYYIVGNMTTYAIASNFRIALLKLQEGNIFGTGFDSNRYYYEIYAQRLYGDAYKAMNVGDAASLFTRILSEFGAVGLMVTIAFLIRKTRIGIKNKNNILIMMVMLFIIQGLRNGSYIITMMILPTVFLLYYSESE